MDDFLKGRRIRVAAADAVLSDGDREAVIEGSLLKVVVEKDPLRICVYDKEGTLLHADIPDLAYMEDSNHRRGWIASRVATRGIASAETVIAVFIGVGGLIILLFIRNTPEEMGLAAYGEDAAAWD